MEDPFDLDRFVRAQAGVYEQALAELRRGRKSGHWMWFVFPQIAGLGRSPTAQAFAIASFDEARAYLAHPILGPRLTTCVRAVNALPSHDAVSIFGSIDALKFRSSMTLFDAADPAEPAFAEALRKFFGGQPDLLTLRGIGRR